MTSRTRSATASTPDENWEEVAEEAQYKFDENGDMFTGIFTSSDVNGTIPQGHFVGTGLFKGEEFFINLGRDLEKKLARVPLGSEVKITRTGTLDTGQQSPMMIFKVNYREA